MGSRSSHLIVRRRSPGALFICGYPGRSIRLVSIRIHAAGRRGVARLDLEPEKTTHDLLDEPIEAQRGSGDGKINAVTVVIGHGVMRHRR